MSMFLDSSRTLPDTKEGLGNPDMSGILLDSPTLLLSWPFVDHENLGRGVYMYFPLFLSPKPDATPMPNQSNT